MPSVPRKLSRLVLGSALMLAPALARAQSLMEFHAAADALGLGAPEAARLRLSCARRVTAAQAPFGSDGFLSLLAVDSGPARLAAFTRDSLRRPEDVLATTPRFGPLPTARIAARGTLDWAWLWDRNGDGRVDYLAYLQNAHPLLPDTIPADWRPPTRNADGSLRLDRPLLHGMIDHARMVFRHYADEDFDGAVDAVVVEAFSETWPMFVAEFVAARRTQDGIEGWAFRQRIDAPMRVLQPDSAGVLWIPSVAADPAAPSIPSARGAATRSRETADARIARGTRILEAINAVAADCARTGTRIVRP